MSPFATYGTLYGPFSAGNARATAAGGWGVVIL